MTIYQLLCLIGVPSLCTIITGCIAKMVAKMAKEMQANSMGTQALLRAQMINDYNKWHDRGYAPIYARDNFENVWKNYHALGANGVMDDIHEKFMNLPTEKE